MKTISVVIADDQALIRSGLQKMLVGEAHISLAGEAPDGAALLAMFERELPDVVLLDMRMPGTDGMAVIRKLAEEAWPVAVVVISQYMELRLVEKLSAAGVQCFLDKDAEKNEVVKAIEAAYAGRCYYSAGLEAKLKAREEERRVEEEVVLTERETEVMLLLCAGKNNKEIGRQLYISWRTVEKIRLNLYKKVGVSNAAKLILWAVHRGYLSPSGAC